MKDKPHTPWYKPFPNDGETEDLNRDGADGKGVGLHTPWYKPFNYTTCSL